MSLTAKQARFVQEYLVDLNATQAAIRAGYSEKTADRIGHENLRKPEIEVAVAKEMAKRSERIEIDADRVLLELSRIAFLDPRKLFTVSGEMRPINELDDATAAAVASIETLEEFQGSGKERKLIGYTKKIKFWDKVSALEKIARHLGMFVDRLKLEGQMQVEVVETIVRTRAEAHAAISALAEASRVPGLDGHG